MGKPNRITVKDMMERYEISHRTARRWRRSLLAAGIVTGVSPSERSVVGDWARVDQAVLVGMVGRPLG